MTPSNSTIWQSHLFTCVWHAQGSVTTPGGSRRFGSFAGRFALASSNPTHNREMLDNYDLLSPEQLRIGARKMRNELDNLYKAGQTCSLKTAFATCCMLLSDLVYSIVTPCRANAAINRDSLMHNKDLPSIALEQCP